MIDEQLFGNRAHSHAEAAQVPQEGEDVQQETFLPVKRKLRFWNHRTDVVITLGFFYGHVTP